MTGAQTLPEWMRRPSPVPARPGGGGSTRFLRRTLRRIDSVFRADFSGETYGERPLLMQGIHPAVKLAVLLSLAVLAGFLTPIPVLLMAAAVPAVYAGLSGIPVGSFLRRAWGYVPVLLLVLSLPGATGYFAPGAPLVPLPGGLYFTAGGLAAAVRAALRAGVSLSCAMVLLLTTRWPELAEGFASLRLPRPAVEILGMAYRYLFVLADLAARRMEARSLRTVGRLTARENRRFMGRSAGALFLHAHGLSGEIYDAMCCRGYGGRVVGSRRRLTGADRLFAAGNLLMALLLLAGERLFG